jgi:hypothetical protein
MSYYSKYLKYKTKYLQLKAQLGGDIITDITIKECGKKKEKDCKEEIGCYKFDGKCYKTLCERNRKGERRSEHKCDEKHCTLVGNKVGERLCFEKRKNI